jgi:hypothetical protein
MVQTTFGCTNSLECIGRASDASAMAYTATDDYPPSGEQYATGPPDLCRALSGKDIGASSQKWVVCGGSGHQGLGPARPLKAQTSSAPSTYGTDH